MHGTNVKKKYMHMYLCVYIYIYIYIYIKRRDDDIPLRVQRELIVHIKISNNYYCRRLQTLNIRGSFVTESEFSRKSRKAIEHFEVQNEIKILNH